jgi:trehalose/maltose transport system substrate-binding protein
VKHNLALIPVTLAVAAVLCVVPALPASAGHAALPAAVGIQAPPVPHAAAIKARFGGQSLTFVGDTGNTQSHTRDLILAARFEQDTGIKVTVVPHPAASGDAYTQLLRNFGSKSPSFDVMMLDVIWPGALAPYLVDLQPALSAEAGLHSPSIIQNDTVNGHLVAMPWFGDYGILYYRTDLLEKYGYRAPPKTWAKLGAMAKKIQAGERKSNPKFYGFVFQGSAYEGLTCDALEWLYSSGAGGMIDNGKVTIDNPTAITTLNMVRGWVGSIAPRDVTTYKEDDAWYVFDAGNAAFMRNWPYAYSRSETSPTVRGRFDVGALPSEPGHAAVGTVGGWQLGISKYSKHIPAATELVRYLTSPAVEKFDAIFNSNVPTIISVAMDPQVRAANPFLKPEIAAAVRVARPATVLGAHYQQGSRIIYQGINHILKGEDARTVLPRVAAALQGLLGT